MVNALQRAADMRDEAAVEEYHRKRRHDAVRAKPRVPHSTLAAKASIIQSALRHHNARKAYATLVQHWRSAGHVFEERGRASSPEVRPTHAAEAAAPAVADMTISGDGQSAEDQREAWMAQQITLLQEAFGGALAADSATFLTRLPTLFPNI